MEVGLEIFAGRHEEALAILDALATGSDHLDPAYFQAAELGQRAVVMLETGRLGEFAPVDGAGVCGDGGPGVRVRTRAGPVRRRATSTAPAACSTTPGCRPRDYTWLSAAVTRLHAGPRAG